jgi:hypothetical protein
MLQPIMAGVQLRQQTLADRGRKNAGTCTVVMRGGVTAFRKSEKVARQFTPEQNRQQLFFLLFSEEKTILPVASTYST